jgi:hypothetical protein
MGINYYSLGSTENNRFVKILQIFFGIVCIGVAVFWLIFNARSLKSDGTLWITIIFLIGFGVYQIWSGLGHTTRFIEISHDSIRLKKNAVLPLVQMLPGEMEKIDFFPLNVIFYLKSKKKILLRFGTIYHETNEKIVDQLIGFAESNNIPFELIEEKL